MLIIWFKMYLITSPWNLEILRSHWMTVGDNSPSMEPASYIRQWNVWTENLMPPICTGTLLSQPAPLATGSMYPMVASSLLNQEGVHTKMAIFNPAAYPLPVYSRSNGLVLNPLFIKVEWCTYDSANKAIICSNNGLSPVHWIFWNQFQWNWSQNITVCVEEN